MIPHILESGIIASAAVTVLKTPLVAPGRQMTILSCMAMDETSAIATAIEIGIIHGTRLIPIDSTPGNFPAGTSHTLFWPCILSPGQGMYAKFTTPAAGDQLRIVAHGYIDPWGDVL